MTTFIRKFLIGIALVGTAAAYAWYFWYQPCNRLSGFDSYAWGSTSGACIRAGCRVTDVQRMGGIMETGSFDTEGERYHCVPKLFP